MTTSRLVRRQRRLGDDVEAICRSIPPVPIADRQIFVQNGHTKANITTPDHRLLIAETVPSARLAIPDQRL